MSNYITMGSKLFFSYHFFSLLKAIAKILPLLFANAFKSIKEQQLLLLQPIYKTHTKIEEKSLRATTFTFAKLEEQ